MRAWLEHLWLRFQLWRYRKEPVNPTYTGEAVTLAYNPTSHAVEGTADAIQVRTWTQNWRASNRDSEQAE